jgi:glycine cleavage system aminomethyltransferase T
MKDARLADIGVNNYGDPLEEARHCRQDSALFDFSFMSRARVTGRNAFQCLNKIQARDLSTMQSGDIRYCLCTDANGVVGADLTVSSVTPHVIKIDEFRVNE